MKKKITYFLKYNKLAYHIYFYLMSVVINILKLFVKPENNLILFNSFAGRKYDDSPKEIFQAIKNDPRFNNYNLVWALHEPNKFYIPGATVIKTDNLKYFIVTLKARAWITNSSMERGLRFKGRNTFYFNTWHGTPIKCMGNDLNDMNESFGLKKNNFCPYDSFCSQGEYETGIFSRAFNIPLERILNVGLPRNDILANYTHIMRTEIRKKLHISNDKIAVLYCPTFREYEKDENYGVISAPPMNLAKWEQELGEKYILLFRAHYEVSRVMDIKENDFIRNVTDYPSLNELIIASDILVSDYSSVFFDFSITEKPMLFFCYDYDKYALRRGMYFDIRTWINGADNEDELIRLISKTECGKSIKTRRFKDEFVNYYGTATTKCVDYIAERLNIVQ